MINDSDFDNIKFPYNESNNFEFKQSIHDDYDYNKYVETICGFLNTGGGYLIFGIADNLDTVGINIGQKRLDKFILKIDEIIRSNKIIGSNNETKEFVKLSNTNIITKLITNKANNKFLIIQIIPEPNIKYQLADGKIYYRLGASNYFEKVEKMLTQSEFDYECKNIIKKANDENKINIQLFQETLGEKNKQIEELNNKLDKEKESNIIYQKQLELSIVNSDKLIKYNNSNVLNNIIKTIFPCLK